ncbi:MAG: hypothetical protein GY720_04740 [bacterium]|nr:hypothetical protein [bacterium]
MDVKWWRSYRAAIRDMGQTDVPGFAGRARIILVFVLPLGLLSMAGLFVGQVVDDPSQLTSLDGLRRLGGIVLMAGIFVAMGAGMIAMFRSEERKRQRWSEVSVDDASGMDLVAAQANDGKFAIRRSRELLFSTLIVIGGVIGIARSETFWRVVGVLALVMGVAKLIGLFLGPVIADDQGVFHPFQWYLGRLKWERLRKVELAARGSIVLRSLPGRSLYIGYDDLEEPESFLALVKSLQPPGASFSDNRRSGRQP